MSVLISRSQVKSWLRDPVTKSLIEALELNIEEISTIGISEFTEDRDDAIALVNTRRGVTAHLSNLLEFEEYLSAYDKLEEEEENEG